MVTWPESGGTTAGIAVVGEPHELQNLAPVPSWEPHCSQNSAVCAGDTEVPGDGSADRADANGGTPIESLIELPHNIGLPQD